MDAAGGTMEGVYEVMFWKMRKVLFFFFGFQGGKIRAKLMTELNGAKDVVIEEGTAGEGGKDAAQIGMRK